MSRKKFLITMRIINYSKIKSTIGAGTNFFSKKARKRQSKILKLMALKNMTLKLKKNGKLLKMKF